MIFIKKHISNLIFVCLFGIVLFKQVPIYLDSQTKKGIIFDDIQVLDLEKTPLRLPIKGKKGVYIFWATWCSPCHIQLKLFKNAVLKGKLNKDQIVAISIDKDFSKVQDFQKDKEYPFRVVVAKPEQNWGKLSIRVTPSIAYVDENRKVTKFSAGVSPLAVLRAKNFFKE